MLHSVSQSVWQSVCRHGKRVLVSQQIPSVNLQQVRTTVIVDRRYPPPLAPKGCLPFMKLRHRVYKVVDRVHSKPTPDITCILTDFVEGVGIRGDIVTVKRRLFRGRLFPAGLAVYASSDNTDKFSSVNVDGKEREEEKRLGVFGQMTLKQLSGLYLPVYMSGDNPWLLNPRHIRVALRNVGVEAKEECIELPQEPIAGPGEFKFRITVNGARSTDIQGCVVLKYKDQSQNVPVTLPNLWTPANPRRKKPTVKSVGIRGDIVTVKRRLFRGRLFPAGLAVYASSDNTDKFSSVNVDGKEREEEKRLGVFGQMTLKQLSGLYLPVYMSGDNPWLLNPRHIRVALRNVGVEAKEECIELPQEPIAGPGEFKFRITVNGARSTDIQGCVVLKYKDQSQNVPVTLPNLWTPANPRRKKPTVKSDLSSSQ